MGVEAWRVLTWYPACVEYERVEGRIVGIKDWPMRILRKTDN